MTDHNTIEGSGSSGPLVACTELADTEHWVLHEISQHGAGVLVNRTASRLGTTQRSVREALAGLIDSGYIIVVEDEFSRIARCDCARNLPGQNPFSAESLTRKTGVDSDGGLGAPSVRSLHAEGLGGPTGLPKTSKSTRNSKFDITAGKVSGPRIVRGLKPSQIAFRLVRYFDRMIVATTGSTWKRSPKGQDTWFLAEVLRWIRRDGLSPELIELMMVEYFRDLAAGIESVDGVHLWRAFVAKRNHYRHLAENLPPESDDDDIDAEAVRPNSILPTRREVEAREGRSRLDT